MQLTERGDEIVHSSFPDDLVLNLSQMRNGAVTRQWQPPLPFEDLTMEEAATKGVNLQYQRVQEAAKAKKIRAEEKATKVKSMNPAIDWRPKVWALRTRPLQAQL